MISQVSQSHIVTDICKMGICKNLPEVTQLFGIITEVVISETIIIVHHPTLH